MLTQQYTHDGRACISPILNGHTNVRVCVQGPRHLPTVVLHIAIAAVATLRAHYSLALLQAYRSCYTDERSDAATLPVVIVFNALTLPHYP
jgi:hypothetical protein